MSRAHTYTEVDWYEEPRTYDLLLEDDTPIEADFLEEVIRRHVRSRGSRERLLEPACGSGRLVRELARRGYDVSGFDLSESMLAFARAKLDEEELSARLFQAALQDFGTRRRFDLAYCLVGSFRYLLSERDARAHLGRVAAALAPGGVYVLGLHLTQYDWQERQQERWSTERGGMRVVCTLTSWPPDERRRRERIRQRTRVVQAGEDRRYETTWDFRTYDAGQLRRLVSSVPDLEHVTTYDFCYDFARERELDDEQLDNVLILRKRATP